MNRIKYYRREKGLTAQELADMLGRTRSFVAVLENGYSPLSYEKANELAKVLGVSAVEIMGDDAFSHSIRNNKKETKKVAIDYIIRDSDNFADTIEEIVDAYSFKELETSKSKNLDSMNSDSLYNLIKKIFEYSKEMNAREINKFLNDLNSYADKKCRKNYELKIKNKLLNSVKDKK